MNINASNTIKVYKCGKASVELMKLKGYELIEELFVDSSGFGTDSEPALTSFNFERKVLELCKIHGTLTAKITRAGQFQVYVGLFKKTNKAIAKKIAGNTYKVDTDEAEYIIYHDTKILQWVADYVILNTGGWLTRTTKDRINAHLPQGVYIFQKAFEWYVKDARDNTIKPFINHMRIAS